MVFADIDVNVAVVSVVDKNKLQKLAIVQSSEMLSNKSDGFRIE